jgi:hypothetical protein
VAIKELFILKILKGGNRDVCAESGSGFVVVEIKIA